MNASEAYRIEKRKRLMYELTMTQIIRGEISNPARTCRNILQNIDELVTVSERVRLALERDKREADEPSEESYKNALYEAREFIHKSGMDNLKLFEEETGKDTVSQNECVHHESDPSKRADCFGECCPSEPSLEEVTLAVWMLGDEVAHLFGITEGTPDEFVSFLKDVAILVCTFEPGTHLEKAIYQHIKDNSKGIKRGSDLFLFVEAAQLVAWKVELYRQKKGEKQ